jgi:hypothetical protein
MSLNNERLVAVDCQSTVVHVEIIVIVAHSVESSLNGLRGSLWDVVAGSIAAMSRPRRSLPLEMALQRPLYCSMTHFLVILTFMISSVWSATNFSFFVRLQLDMITDLMGTPSPEEMKHACEGARLHMRRSGHKPPAMTALYTLSPQATHEAVFLLSQMLVFDPVRIWSCTVLDVASDSSLACWLFFSFLF